MAWNGSVLRDGVHRELSGLHPDYVIYEKNSVCYAKACTSGLSDYSNPLASVTLQEAFIAANALPTLPNKREIFLKGKIPVTEPMTLTLQNMDVYGGMIVGDGVDAVFSLTLADVTFENMFFTNNGASLVLYDSVNSSIQRCRFEDGVSGITMFRCNNMHVERNYFDTLTDQVINLQGADGGNTNIYVEDNVVTGCGSDLDTGAIFANLGSNFIIRGNTIKNHAATNVGMRGIYTLAATKVTIDDNILDTLNVFPIDVDISTDFRIRHNKIFVDPAIGNVFYGMVVSEADQGDISHNSVTCSAAHNAAGIRLFGSDNGVTNTKIIGNTVRNCTIGIDEGMGSYNNIALNDLRGNIASMIPTTLNTKISGNQGYNPVGNVATPWFNGAGSLSDVPAALDNPVSDALYTINQSPKLIILTNCAGISAVQIDGATLTNITTDDPQIYRLEPGQTIHVVWATTTPHGEVFAQ